MLGLKFHYNLSFSFLFAASCLTITLIHESRLRAYAYTRHDVGYNVHLITIIYAENDYTCFIPKGCSLM